MDNLAAIMAAAQITEGGITLASAYGQAGALQGQANWARESGDFASRMAGLQAKDVERRGALSATAIRQQGQRIIGSQRAALAAQGIDIATGSAVDVQADTARQAELDAQQVEANAWRQAWGIREQGREDAFAGRMQGADLDQRAFASALTGGAAFVRSGVAAADTLSRVGKKKIDPYATAAQAEATARRGR